VALRTRGWARIFGVRLVSDMNKQHLSSRPPLATYRQYISVHPRNVRYSEVAAAESGARSHLPGAVDASGIATPRVPFWRAAMPAPDARKPAQRAGRPSSFSMLRRSRLVGRPAPRSRTATGMASSRGGGGGLLSI
jgi:hypothetical protein